MNKFEVIPLDEKQERLSEFIGKYYSVAHPKLIDAIRIEIFHPKKSLKERKKAYKEFEDVILALKSLFREIIYEQNKFVRKKGYKNYFEFRVKRDGISKKKVDWFFHKADKIIEHLHQILPWSSQLPKWYWSEFNIPDPLSLIKAPKYLVPEDIYRLTEKVLPKVKEIIPLIKIEKVKDFNPSARFVKETKSVIIKAPTKPSIYNALTFVHELGHALSFVELAEKGIDPLTKSIYWHDMEAGKFEFQFEELCLPKEVKNASKGQMLGDFLTAFFEYEIHNNPNQDFDEAYAKAKNRCYPKANQVRNPFYVLESGLIARPCGTMVTSVVEAILLSENFLKKN